MCGHYKAHLAICTNSPAGGRLARISHKKNRAEIKERGSRTKSSEALGGEHALLQVSTGVDERRRELGSRGIGPIFLADAHFGIMQLL
jgi:hypothetical protein